MIIPADIRLGNICISVDTTGHFCCGTEQDSDYARWLGFKQAMEKNGGFCSRSRYVVVPQEPRRRLKKYEELLPHFLETKALAFSSDYTAVEAINFLQTGNPDSGSDFHTGLMIIFMRRSSGQS